MFGTAMETIVWSMKVIETAKIIAASTQLRPCIPLPLNVASLQLRSLKTLTAPLHMLEDAALACADAMGSFPVT